MATQTEEAVLETKPSTNTISKKAVADLMSELALEDQQSVEGEGESRLTKWTRVLTTAPEILILVVWIAMMYALWTQFRGPILGLLK